MFTGIVSAIGRVALVAAAERTFECPPDWLAHTAIGDSIAVNGACLTVTALQDTQFSVTLSPETRRCCVDLAANQRINLEHALAVGDKLSGHFVGGHIDGIAAIHTVAANGGGGCDWRVLPPPPLLRFIAAKGSVCLDGVSLTVNDVDKDGFTVTLIPHTLSHTSFADYRPATLINIEIDMLARYIERLLHCPPE